MSKRPIVGETYEIGAETLIPSFVEEIDGGWYVEFRYPEGGEQHRRIIEQRCALCSEEISVLDVEHGNLAEMYDPAQEPNRPGYAFTSDSFVVHAECGLARGWEIA